MRRIKAVDAIQFASFERVLETSAFCLRISEQRSDPRRKPFIVHVVHVKRKQRTVDCLPMPQSNIDPLASKGRLTESSAESSVFAASMRRTAVRSCRILHCSLLAESTRMDWPFCNWLPWAFRAFVDELQPPWHPRPQSVFSLIVTCNRR